MLGAGSWGTALAHVLAENHHEVRVWGRNAGIVERLNQTHTNERYLPGVRLHQGIIGTTDLSWALADAGLVLLSIPSRWLPEFFSTIHTPFSEGTVVLHTVKGFVRPSNVRVSEFLSDVPALTKSRLAVLSGPSHAEEVVRGVPTTVVVASKSKRTAEFVQDAFMNPYFRVYGQSDIVGVELGGTLKNIIALGVGLVEGLGLGDNTRAALMTRGLAEMTRLGIALGASPLTFSGLSGIGDLIVTCTSQHSRNFRAGRLLGTGVPLTEVLDSIGMAVEGIGTTYAAYELAQDLGVEMPITSVLRSVLKGELDPRHAVRALMQRDKNHEMEDVGQRLLSAQEWSEP